ncbi:MAG: F-type H+-transporting ATPase subunit epsilon [Acidimicrobiales bacterium]|jgi:F-type H+-transporting ATPase subunit epsilon
MAFQVEFVSPEASLYSGEGIQVVARTRGGGEIAFLTGHESFVGSLQASEVRVTESGGDVLSFAVRSGFVSVTGDSVTVLSDAAVPSPDIDVTVAQAELEAAQAALAVDSEDAFAAEDVQWAELLIRLAAKARAA